MSSKTISLLIILAGIAVSGLIFFSDFGNKEGEGVVPQKNNVYIQDGKQIIQITAKGGFEPASTIAKAGVPTTLRITTEGTFDCSSVISIPELKIRQNLPSSGTTDIDLGVRPAGVLDGTCGMGMYPFTIEFK